MIKKCIMLPYNGEDSCDAVIDKVRWHSSTRPDISGQYQD